MIQAMFGFFLMLLGLVFFTRGAGDYYKNKPINANLNLPAGHYVMRTGIKTDMGKDKIIIIDDYGKTVKTLIEE